MTTIYNYNREVDSCMQLSKKLAEAKVILFEVKFCISFRLQN